MIEPNFSIAPLTFMASGANKSFLYRCMACMRSGRLIDVPIPYLTSKMRGIKAKMNNEFINGVIVATSWYKSKFFNNLGDRFRFFDCDSNGFYIVISVFWHTNLLAISQSTM